MFGAGSCMTRWWNSGRCLFWASLVENQHFAKPAVRVDWRFAFSCSRNSVRKTLKCSDSCMTWFSNSDRCFSTVSLLSLVTPTLHSDVLQKGKYVSELQVISDSVAEHGQVFVLQPVGIPSHWSRPQCFAKGKIFKNSFLGWTKWHQERFPHN